MVDKLGLGVRVTSRVNLKKGGGTGSEDTKSLFDCYKT